MTTEKVFDVTQFKAGQKEQWDAVAQGWTEWALYFENQWEGINERLIELAAIQNGDRVLDIATGVGDPAMSVARHVGPEGLVIAIDQSPQMLACAQERASKARLENLKFRQMDAETLDLPHDSFDSVVCRWGLMLLPDLPSALDRIRNLLVPGGALAAAVWDTPQNVPFLSLPINVGQRVFNMPPPPAQAPSPFGLAGGVLEQQMARAGFSDVMSQRVPLTIMFPSVEAYNQFQREVNPQAVSILATQPAEKIEAFQQQLTDAIKPYVQADGKVVLPNSTICVSGRRME
jgi:ubiquinone/menaquinone biosynthesis C-methylase UbiE